MLNQLIAYYNAYETELIELYRKAPPMAGFLGMGNHPKNDRCNDVFFENVKKWTEEFLATNSNQEEAEAVVEWILKLADRNRKHVTYWFCYVIQLHTKELIPMIGQKKAMELQAWYNEAYPKNDRLPVHTEIYQLLRKQAGCPEEKGFRWFWKK